MGEWLRLVAVVALSGAALTVAATVAARLMTEERRLLRVFRKGLGAAPDAYVIARGAGRGAALSLQTRRIATVWDGGRWRLDYSLDELIGAELELDGEIAARVVRGEERRRLDRSSAADREVLLRLLFDDPRHPDFELQLWPVRPRKTGEPRARAAVAEANRWLGRVEAVLRRSGSTAAVGRTRSSARIGHRPLEADLFEDDEADVSIN